MAASSQRLVLSLSLDTSERQAKVCCLLEREERHLDEWRFTAEEMGLPDLLDRRKALHRGYEFRIPAGVLNAMKGWVEPHRPLWLRLERPSGYLRLVPWEQLLQPRLEVPVLRLPEIETERSRESPRSLDVILCGSLPVAKDPFPLAEHLVRIAEHIQSAVPRRTTLHVFTDRASHHEVEQRFEARGSLGAAVRLYSPKSAEPYAVPDPTSRIQDPAGRIESPWLLWIRDALKGRSIDVAHFLCHGYLRDEQGALALAESPLENQDRQTARFTGATELSIFMTQVGAWSVAFSSPEHNYSEMGLRLLADAMTLVRPGPVLHQELRLDPDCLALAEAYGFLYGPPGAPPPASPALSLSCQPSWLAAPAMPATPRASRRFSLATPATRGLEKVFESEDNVPGWIAAAERSIEQAGLCLQKLEKGSEAAAARRTELDPVEENLRRVQEIVARAAAKPGDKP